MTKELIGQAVVLSLTACVAGTKVDGAFDTGANDGNPYGSLTGCETMASWFQACSEDDIAVAATVEECEANLNRITAECDIDAATAYSEGLTAAYTCYLELDFCGTEEDLSAHPDAFAQCGALFDQEIAPYEECIYNAGEDIPDLATQSTPNAIDFVEPIELRNHLPLDDDDYSHLELPFQLSFFGETVQTLTITSNGLILVGAQHEDGCCFGQSIPQEDHLDGLIALGWGDLIPSSEHGIYWDVLGEMPNRELWISYDHLPTYSGTSNIMAARLRVMEGSTDYDIFIDSIIYDEPMTIGIEAPDGRYAVVGEAHNASSIVIEKEAYRYTASVPQ